MMLIAVTGGIGAGKTTALREFRRLGVRTIDADDVVHRLYSPGTPVYDAVRARWGQAVTDARGQIVRSAIAQRVFRNPSERAWLNRLIHPLVKEELLNEASRTPADLFCGIPLLFESGWDVEVDISIAVWCDRALQATRLRERGWSDAEIEQRVSSQMPDSEKLTRADYGIVNVGSIAGLRQQCRRVLARISECVQRDG